MTRRTNHLPDGLQAYLRSVSPPEHPVLSRLREETAKLPKANMQIGHRQSAVPGVGAHLERAPGSHQRHQERHELPLLGADLHVGLGQLRRLFPESA